MIKVNLLPQRKAKRVAEPGSREMVMGLGALAVAALGVFFIVDRPRRSHLSDERANSINRLISAKVVPANVLHELGEILTNGHAPTMTEEMSLRTGNGPLSDPNKRFDPTWDPTHVWLMSFVDHGGDFRLEGGAQAEGDVTQLSKRLAASAYFVNVAPNSEERVADKDTGISYFRFIITGKVIY